MEQNTGITPYYQSGVSDVEHRDIDAAGDDHPFGTEPKEFKADLRPLMKQIADQLYDTWEATVREYLANAETACLKVEQYKDNPMESPFDDMIVDSGYYPAIVVTWRRDEQKLIIQDNGIGMAAIEVDEVFRYVGRSAARDLGDMSGAFGMGALSFAKFIGLYNTMIMLSHSRLNDDNAAYLVSLSGIEPIMGSLADDVYGTKFKMDQKDSDMNVRSAVSRYAEWMRVPVLYYEYDESGEEVFNEDWGDRRLYDSYDEDTWVEPFTMDGLFEAYHSPDASGETLLLSMPIDRGDSACGSQQAPWNIDIRILDESGAVVSSDSGHEGMTPVPRKEYEEMLLEARPDYITETLLSRRDVTAFVVESDEADYAVDGDMLESDEALPIAEYVTIDAAEELGDKKVIMGQHSGRTVVSEEEWDELPQLRAAGYIPEDELSDDDICLPKPTTDRSSLQDNPEFWNWLDENFINQFDASIDEYRQLLCEEKGNEEAAIRAMDKPTVKDLQ